MCMSSIASTTSDTMFLAHFTEFGLDLLAMLTLYEIVQQTERTRETMIGVLVDRSPHSSLHRASTAKSKKVKTHNESMITNRN